MSLCQKKNQNSFTPLPQPKMLQSKNLWLSSRDHSVTGRGSEAYKQWNELGMECGACSCVCVCVFVHMCVCLPALPNNSKPQGFVGQVCLKPKPRGTASSLLWPFPREAWSFITNFSPGPLAREASPRAAGEPVRRRQAQIAPEGIPGMLMGCLSGGLPSPELGLRTVLWPSVEAQEVS